MLHDPRSSTLSKARKQDECFSSAVFTYVITNTTPINTIMFRFYCVWPKVFGPYMWPSLKVKKLPKSCFFFVFFFGQERSWSIAMEPSLQPNYGPPMDARLWDILLGGFSNVDVFFFYEKQINI